MTDRPPPRSIDDILVSAHDQVRKLEDMVRSAKADRARTWAIAQQRHGRSAGDISRLLGPKVTPTKVGDEIRVGRRLLEIAARKGTA